MNTNATAFGRTRNLAAHVTTGLVLAGSVLGGSALAAEAAPAAAPAPTRAAAPASATYAAVTGTGSTRTLQLVSRSTGKVVRTVATARVTGQENPFIDVDVASDGTVWAVVADRRLPSGYQSSLVHYDAKGAHRVLPYVTSVEASPSSKTVAVSVTSPDGDGDGRGLTAVRTLTSAGKVRATLMSSTFPVDDDGEPQIEAQTRVDGWVGEGALAVSESCCDSGDVKVISATKPTRTWGTSFGGTGAETIGVRGSNVLVQAAHNVYDKKTKTWTTNGSDAFWVSAKNPKGVLSRHYSDDVSSPKLADRMNAAAHATPLVVSPTTFPYRGAGRVVAAYL